MTLQHNDNCPFPPYPAYKDSGVEWIGEVPEHWTTKKFKYWFDSITEKGDTHTNKIGLENIESRTGKFINTKSNFQGDGICFVENDILFGKLRPYLAKVYLADCDGSAVGDFLVFRSKKGVMPKFALHRILSQPFIEITNSSTYGAKMPRVSWEFISTLKIAFPPKDEQTTIAHFLDHKTAQIDAAIDKHRQLIELLREHRAALINEAVTKGLNPNAPMKDSGVEWIGEVPAHWRTMRIKYIAKILSGVSPEIADPNDNGEIPYFKVDSINYDSFKLDKPKYFTSHEQLISSNEIILFPKRGAAIALNKVGVTNASICFDTNLMGLKPDENKILITYLASILKGISLINIADTSTIPQINNKHIDPLIIPLPTIEEQREIMKLIGFETTRIDEEINLAQQEINLLEEYRQSLIAEAVTGKIDVRDYVLEDD